MRTNSYFQPQWGPVLRGLVADPEAKHYHRLKNSLWLYLYFLTTVGPKTGRVATDIGRIAKDMGLKPTTISSWLGHLREKHYVNILKMRGQTVVQVNQWRKVSFVFGSVEQVGQRRLANERSKSKTTRESVEPSVDPAVEARATEIAKALDDPDNLPSYQRLCQEYADEITKKALTKVKSVPDDKIKKSRGALFTYLVKTYAKSNSTIVSLSRLMVKDARMRQNRLRLETSGNSLARPSCSVSANCFETYS